MQSLLQQSPFVAQGSPSGLHVGAGMPHVPPLHALLQQSLAVVQLAPSEAQLEELHVPLTQSLLQQSGLLVQLDPRPAHAGAAHWPAVHVPLQQSLELAQALPADMQVDAAQVPAVQVALQQSLDRAQAWPVLRQISCAQTPAEHDMLQQSVYALHEAPPERHLPGDTGLLLPASAPELLPEPPELLLDPGPSPDATSDPLSGANPPESEPFDAQPWAEEARTNTPASSANRPRTRCT